jgi:hypothetical protein
MAVLLREELRKTDKMCDQWARERRDIAASLKCTLHNMALVKEGVVLEGPFDMSDESLLIDRIYLSAPAKEKSILIVWYGDGAPVVIKAKKLGIPRSTLYVVWTEVLAYVRGRLHGFGVDV